MSSILRILESYVAIKYLKFRPFPQQNHHVPRYATPPNGRAAGADIAARFGNHLRLLQRVHLPLPHQECRRSPQLVRLVSTSPASVVPLTVNANPSEILAATSKKTTTLTFRHRPKRATQRCHCDYQGITSTICYMAII